MSNIGILDFLIQTKKDVVRLDINDKGLGQLSGDQVVRVGQNVYDANGIRFKFERDANVAEFKDCETGSFYTATFYDDENELKQWFEKHADNANMQQVEPTLQCELPDDVLNIVRNMVKKAGKRKMRKTKKARKTRRRTVKRRSSTRRR